MLFYGTALVAWQGGEIGACVDTLGRRTDLLVTCEISNLAAGARKNATSRPKARLICVVRWTLATGEWV